MTTEEKAKQVLEAARKRTQDYIESFINEEFEKLHESTKLTDSKPTRYPNGAYVHIPNKGTTYFVIFDGLEIEECTWKGFDKEISWLKLQQCFPTKEAAGKELNRQQLTAKMYRDMQDERINGEWVADWGDTHQSKWYPFISRDKIFSSSNVTDHPPHDFYYKKDTFISDLKALGWTEEELKIVWFRV